MATSKKTPPIKDYFKAKVLGWNPENPRGYFSLMGAAARKKEESKKKAADKR